LETANALLRSLSSDDYHHLQTFLRPIGFGSGHVLYEPEDAVEWVYFPESGLVSLISVMLSGDQVESAVVGREGAVGFVEAAGAGIIFSRAVVQIDLVAQRASARAYRAALDASASLRRTIASHVELTIAEGRQTIACIAHHAVEARLAWWLLECQDRTGLSRLALTQEFLSAMLGIQRSTISLAAAPLKAAGLINYSRGVITILDRAGLQNRACECYETGRHFRELIERPGEAAPLTLGGPPAWRSSA
jgi:CRP-like cAMP-binding protein